MLACVDVDYRPDGSGSAACVLFDAWRAEHPTAAHVVRIEDEIAPYEPGDLFKRELPCILRVLEEVTVPLAAIVVDGYVTLDPLGRPGLGARLYAALGEAVAVIGVAKTPYKSATMATPVERGGSRSPLWITAAGIDPAVAAAHVQAMHGAHRIPTLLRRVDRLARDGR